MHSSRTQFVFLLILVIGIVAGCGESNPSEPPEPTVKVDSPLTVTSPLSPPAAVESSKSLMRTPLPQPPEGKGAVTGRMINVATGQRMIAMTVYLGDVASMGESEGNVVTIKENASPHTLTDADGYFALTDIEPGTYALVLWTPLNSIVVEDPDNAGKYFLVTVESAKITDLGEVVSVLP